MNTINLIDKLKQPIAERVRDILIKKDITEAQWQVMSYMYAHKNMTAAEVAEGSGKMGPSLSRMIKRFEADGIISVKLTPEDKRRLNINLTGKGKRVYKGLVNRIDKAMAVDRKDLDVFIVQIRKLARYSKSGR